MIYLCFPNNPTGAAATREQLQGWVDYANKNGALIIFDAAYEAYITQKELPHSIYECEGARTCAIELRSFSKKCRIYRCASGLYRGAKGPEMRTGESAQSVGKTPRYQIITERPILCREPVKPYTPPREKHSWPSR